MPTIVGASCYLSTRPPRMGTGGTRAVPRGAALAVMRAAAAHHHDLLETLIAFPAMVLAPVVQATVTPPFRALLVGHVADGHQVKYFPQPVQWCLPSWYWPRSQRPPQA